MTASLRYRAVLFDLDGTLVDSYTALTEAVNHARRAEGLHELSSARIRTIVGDGVEKLLQRAFERADIPRSIVDAFESRYDEVCCQESKVLADVEATLEHLAALGVAMAVCTNKPTVFSKKILDFLGALALLPRDRRARRRRRAEAGSAASAGHAGVGALHAGGDAVRRRHADRRARRAQQRHRRRGRGHRIVDARAARGRGAGSFPGAVFGSDQDRGARGGVNGCPPSSRVGVEATRARSRR